MQFIYKNITEKMFKWKYGVSTPLPLCFCIYLTAACLNYIGSSDSVTSVSDYIENKTKMVGRLNSVYDVDSCQIVEKTSVSSVKNHNSRPEICYLIAEKLSVRTY